MTERLTALLSLLAQDSYKPLDELAQKMSLSTKTVRGLLDDLDGQLSGHGARIERKRGLGYRLDVEDTDKFQTLFVAPAERTPGDSRERISYLVEHFLRNETYVKMDTLCDNLYVSRKTLTADLRQVEAYFSTFHLSIERKPHYGMKLTGDEFQKRHCMADYLEKRSRNTPASVRPRNPQEYQIAQCLISLLENEDYHITDVGLNSLVMHIVVALERIRSGQYITLREEEYQRWSAGAAYDLARRCAERVTALTGVAFPEEEIRYLAIHFASKEADQNFVIDSSIQETAAEMLEEVYQVFQIDFREDLELIVALSSHLVPLVIRIKYGMRLKNPMLQEIRHQYSLAYAIALQASAVLERRYHCILDANEVAYLALTFQLSLEHRRTHAEKKNVLLVCASGAATSRLMAYKMQENFADYIGRITICDQRSISKQDFSEVDYVFTTVPIEEHVPVPICMVDHFLESNGTLAVRGFLARERKADILQYYPQQLFFPDLHAADKEEALRKLVELVDKVHPLPKGFYEAVLQREGMAHTCMGNRVAMPHPCKVMTDDTFVSVALLHDPIQWDEQNTVQAIFLVSVSKKKNKKLQDFYSITARLLLDGGRIDRLLEERTYQTLAECLASADKERTE